MLSRGEGVDCVAFARSLTDEDYEAIGGAADFTACLAEVQRVTDRARRELHALHTLTDLAEAVR